MNSDSPRATPNLRARHGLSLGLALCATLVGGCASIPAPISGRPGTQANASQGVARSWPEVWGRVQQALRIGQVSEQRFLAARDEDSKKFAQAERDLALLQLYSPAEAEVMRGKAWTSEVAQAQGAKEKAQLQASESHAYQRAIELSPGGNFSSKDPDLLNALGYFLADKGTAKQDFQRAENLTRQALRLQDKAVDEVGHNGEENLEFLSARYSRANTRDSLAWALYKQAQADGVAAGDARALLAQAQREQQDALDEARQALAASQAAARLGSAQALSAELPLHMAMILRAQNALEPSPKREEEAQALLREAIALDPKLDAAREALGH